MYVPCTELEFKLLWFWGGGRSGYGNARLPRTEIFPVADKQCHCGCNTHMQNNEERSPH